MRKQQGYEELYLNDNETLSEGLGRINESIRAEIKGDLVEIVQVIPRKENQFTLVYNVYYKS
ncbi:hypothetical protein CN330_23825 [Priestia megaterium]|uniref:hypothetical protein n=1 Tax=Priestia megaterium TaxID=1404 RepID=UPI000BF706C6|nr:hypothetical protein [Priestia megaterium]PEZ08792.1 hypothetical protein CN330_23825 [Priestia megaterium]